MEPLVDVSKIQNQLSGEQADAGVNSDSSDHALWSISGGQMTSEIMVKTDSDAIQHSPALIYKILAVGGHHIRGGEALQQRQHLYAFLCICFE